MDFAIPEEIERLCAGVRRFMDEHVYSLERSAHWKAEAGVPAYPPAVRAVQAKAKALGYWAFHLPSEAGGAGIPLPTSARCSARRWRARRTCRTGSPTL